MSDYCECCATNRQYVQEHLNWDPRVPGVHPDRWGARRWLAYARDCMAFWVSQGDPVEMDHQELAAHLRSLYARPDEAK